MLPNEQCELENLRKKLLKIGIGYPVKKIKGPTGPKGDIGPTGPKGDTGSKGDAGPVIPSSTESIFYTTFQESDTSDQLIFENPWILPNHSEYIEIKENQVSLAPGVYEMTLSGQITNADADHGATFYVQTTEGSEIKGLSFQLDKGNINQMYYSRTILFRFENKTELEILGYIIGDENTSNIIISEVNLYIKKIHE